MRLASQQFSLYLDAKFFGDGTGNRQMTVVDFGQPRIDDLLVQLFLLLELEYLACFFRQHAGDAVECDIVVIGVEGGDDLDGHPPVPGQCQCGQQAPVSLRRAVQRDHDRAVTDRAGRLLDDQRIDDRAARHAAAYTAQAAALYRAEAERPHDKQVMGAGIGLLRERTVILSFQRTAPELDAEFLALGCGLVEIGVGDDGQAARDQAVMHLPLPLQFLFLAELFGQAAFHLAEAHVVQSGGIHMGAGDRGIAR